jgi:3-hydroxy-9,10-secoandrosta-1,3,5(10)-triene-9,17-dione monooxygenase reductase component
MSPPDQHLVERRTLRHALGEFATGVTIVTALRADGTPAGVTINSFASVSLEPPLVLWSLGLQASVLTVFEGCRHYAVNVLAADQTEYSQRFAQSQGDPFAGIDLESGASGTPMLPGCCAWFECRNQMRHAGGDHLIFVGHVENFRRQDKPPLIFHRGLYRSLP